MFERKNQKLEHYAKVVDHGASEDENEDDFITLKRVDHEIEGERSKELEENLSKRQQKLGRAKRAVATGGLSKRVVFDDEGQAHEVYEMGDVDDWMKEKGGLEGAIKEGVDFALGERDRMKVTDIVDRAQAKEKKQEKKRKRKEREKEVGE
jgi:ATP-dependent RNA helicase DDX10/DBP4